MSSFMIDNVRSQESAQIAVPSSSATAVEGLEQLQRLQAEHPIWNCRLLRACRAGLLTREDFRHIFSQYFRYSKNFTRYLAALMMNCDSDYYRSRLSENLWEEGGGAEPDQRHAELFRRFLREALEIDIQTIEYQSFANDFFHQYLDFCRNAPPLEGSAFLSLGTEGAIARLYGDFCEGLLKAGVPEEQLSFFRIHMECDDEHAITLAELMCSYADQPGWFAQCRAAMNRALDIRQQFLDDALDFALNARLKGLLDHVRQEDPRLPEGSEAKDFVYSGREPGADVSGLYSNQVERLNIDFTVRRVGFEADVFDVRVVNIPPHRNNELHRHSHESLLTVTRGQGKVRVGDHLIDVAAGDTVFVPRWVMHQTQNTGDEPMELFAVTDYGLTRRAFLGDNLRTTRMTPSSDADAR